MFALLIFFNLHINCIRQRRQDVTEEKKEQFKNSTQKSTLSPSSMATSTTSDQLASKDIPDIILTLMSPTDSSSEASSNSKIPLMTTEPRSVNKSFLNYSDYAKMSEANEGFGYAKNENNNMKLVTSKVFSYL